MDGSEADGPEGRGRVEEAIGAMDGALEGATDGALDVAMDGALEADGDRSFLRPTWAVDCSEEGRRAMNSTSLSSSDGDSLQSFSFFTSLSKEKARRSPGVRARQTSL